MILRILIIGRMRGCAVFFGVDGVFAGARKGCPYGINDMSEDQFAGLSIIYSRILFKS